MLHFCYMFLTKLTHKVPSCFQHVNQDAIYILYFIIFDQFEHKIDNLTKIIS